MWSVHHVTVIVAISARFSFSISDSSVIFGTTVLLFLVPLILCLYLRPQTGPIFHTGLVYYSCLSLLGDVLEVRA